MLVGSEERYYRNREIWIDCEFNGFKPAQVADKIVAEKWGLSPAHIGRIRRTFEFREDEDVDYYPPEFAHYMQTIQLTPAGRDLQRSIFSGR
jgi:hypothetical protein